MFLEPQHYFIFLRDKNLLIIDLIIGCESIRNRLAKIQLVICGFYRL
jgi:hypothetical protein